ncbi:MAG: low molecular weight phosphotyrosine protein phosphatase [Muribaculaceae bacterium]|nr:low molecular weight phosphotyrosine protein phosphatase [Muribaculaceae bacterium]
MDPKRILFVCLGNICRSPAAEEIMRVMAADAGVGVEVDSAGTGNYHIGEIPDKRMRVHALRRGYDLSRHSCRQVSADDFDRFDLIVGMDASNVANLRRMAPSPEAERKVVGIGEFLDPGMGFDHIPDPYYEGAEGFERVLTLLENGCSRLISTLR